MVNIKPGHCRTSPSRRTTHARKSTTLARRDQLTSDPLLWWKTAAACSSSGTCCSARTLSRPPTRAPRRSSAPFSPPSLRWLRRWRVDSRWDSSKAPARIAEFACFFLSRFFAAVWRTNRWLSEAVFLFRKKFCAFRSRWDVCFFRNVWSAPHQRSWNRVTFSPLFVSLKAQAGVRNLKFV